MTEEGSLLTTGGAAQEQGGEVNQEQQATQTGQEQSQAASAVKWTDALPDDLKGAEVLGKYADQNAALKALVEAQKVIGKPKEGLVPPGEDAKPEEVEAFQAKLRELRGVPDSPDKYEVAAPEDAPEGYALDANLVGAFQKLAHEAGIAPSEFKRLADGYMQMEIAAINKVRQDSAAAAKKAEADLVKQWQAEGLAPKEGFSQALKAAEALGLVGKDKDLLGSLGNNTALIAQLQKVWPVLSEAGLKGGGVAQDAPHYTPKEALEKGRAMMRDPRYADPLRRDPEYVREVQQHFERYGSVIAGGAK